MLSFPAAGSAQRAGGVTEGGRRKMPMRPGRSLNDWIRISTARNLSTVNGPLRITPTELSKHATVTDAWTAIRGKVYNITPYIEYHPGGSSDLMRAAGIDCTPLFDEYHAWVNFETMLKSCFVGFLIPDAPVPAIGVRTVDKDGFSIPQVPTPTHSWTETETELTILIIVSNIEARKDSVDLDLQATHCSLCFEDNDANHTPFVLRVQFKFPVNTTTSSLQILSSSITLTLQKTEPLCLWKSLGHSVLDRYSPIYEAGYFALKVKQLYPVTPQTWFLELNPEGLIVPCGQHVVLKLPSCMNFLRAFTPILSTSSSLQFLIKVYEKGKFTAQLPALVKSSIIMCSRPVGSFNAAKQLTTCAKVVMFCTGTGITPMLRIFRLVLKEEPALYTNMEEMHLVFSNRREQDIIARGELDEFSNTVSKPTVKVTYILSQPPTDWLGGVGRIDTEVCHRHLTPHEAMSTLVLVCGQALFTSEIGDYAKRLGFTNIHLFI